MTAALAVILAASQAWSVDIATSPRPATLSEVVALVLEKNPAAAEAASRSREAEAALGQARLSSLPRLEADAAATRGDNPVYVFSTLLEQRRFSPNDFNVGFLNSPGYMNDYQGQVKMVAPLFTAFEASSREKMGSLALEGARAAEDSLRQSLRLQAIRGFLAVLAARALSDELRAREASSEKEILEARRLKAKGLVLGSDYYAATAILGELKAWGRRVDGELSSAELKLWLLAGAEAGEFKAAGALGSGAYDLPPMREMVAAAVRERGEARRAALAEASAGVDRRRVQMSLLPRVGGFGTFETDTWNFQSGPSNRLVGLQASMPFGDPTYGARLARARAAEEAARAARSKIEQDVRAEMEGAYASYRGLVEGMPSVRESVAASSRSLEMVRPLYRNGRQSVMEVLRAEEACARMEEAWMEVLEGLHGGYARLLLIEGRLDAKAVETIDKRLR
jgi:outer membrane protein TolC